MKQIIQLLFILAVIIAFLITIGHAQAAESPELKVTVPEELLKDPVKSFAYSRILQEFGPGQWESFDRIITMESQWDPLNNNPKSSAKELGQLLDSTRKWLGLEYTKDPYLQVEHAIVYIDRVYGNPNEAWRVWQTKSWY